MEVKKLDFTRTFRSLSNILNNNHSIQVDESLNVCLVSQYREDC